MGMPSANIAQPMSQNQPSGKGGAFGSTPASQQTAQDTQPQPIIENVSQPTQQPMGKGGSASFPSQGGQPRMGQPNNYSNTVGPWDNANIQPRQTQSGKGKGY